MNERIGKLAEQAGLLGPRSRVGNSHEAAEKFAELIVRECVDLVDTLNEAYGAPSTAGKFIKKHFGIE